MVMMVMKLQNHIRARPGVCTALFLRNDAAKEEEK
jgi:hypothetical protein